MLKQRELKCTALRVRSQCILARSNTVEPRTEY